MGEECDAGPGIVGASILTTTHFILQSSRHSHRLLMSIHDYKSQAFSDVAVNPFTDEKGLLPR